MRFSTNFVYRDRATKSEYVWRKYHTILQGPAILDVGSDKAYLRRYLDPQIHYVGIDLGGTPDIKVNLEKGAVPFRNHTFDCVLCLDVLEHLDNIHAAFDEVCRVSRQYVIISLPNPWRCFLDCLRTHEYRPGQPTKFYGLPSEPPADRHKWFFSREEAERFISDRGHSNNMHVLQIDHQPEPHAKALIRQLTRTRLFRRDLDLHTFTTDTVWAVLERQQG